MEFTYENQGTNTYLCCDLTAMEIDTMGLGMITNNQIPGFIQSIFTQVDDRKYIKYNVSSKVSVKQFFSGPVNRKRLLNVFAKIAEVLMVSEEYMLDMNSVLLDADYIFVNVSDCSAEVIYVPAVIENGGNMEAAAFFKHIMFTTQFDASENRDYVAEIINFLNQKDVFSIGQFKKLLDRLKQQPQKQPERKGQPEEKPAGEMEKENSPTRDERKPAEQKPESISPEIGVEQEEGSQKISLLYLLQHYNKENADIYKAQRDAKKQRQQTASEKAAKKEGAKKQAKKAAEASVTFAVPGQQKIPGTAVMEAASECVPEEQSVPIAAYSPLKAEMSTSPYAVSQNQQNESVESTQISSAETEYMDQETVLREDNTLYAQAYLLRLKNNEKIPLDREILHIGRDREKADYLIPENKFVGHKHCHILSRNGEFFVVDDNSKNHTYVDGTMIQNDEEVKLSHGAILRVADEEFEFKLF